MNNFTKSGIALALCLATGSTYAATPNNSSIDLAYKGEVLFNNAKVKDAYKPVESVDNGKIEAERTMKELLQNANYVKSVYYTKLDGNQQLSFIGGGNGQVEINFSGFGIEAKGKAEDPYVGIDFDWEIDVSNMTIVADYSFMDGKLENPRLLNTYTIVTDAEADGLVGLIISVVELFGLDANGYLSDELHDMVEEEIVETFGSKFNAQSKTLFALDEVVPDDIYYQGENISQTIKDYLVAPINGKAVTFTFDLENSINQSISVNLWNDVELTVRRIKPVVSSSSYTYLDCVGYKRHGYIEWDDTGSESTYTIQKRSGSTWYTQATKSTLVQGVSGYGGTHYYRIRSERQEVVGPWKYLTANFPSCSGGGGLIIK